MQALNNSIVDPTRLLKIACIIVSISMLTSINLMAGPIYSGSSMTTGPSSNHFSMASSFYNPAMNALVVNNEEKENNQEETWRISYFPSLALNAEIGPVDNFVDDIDELIDLLDNPNSASQNESSNELLARFNSTLTKIGDSGYIKQNISINAPLFPLYYRLDRLDGVMGMDLTFSSHIGTRILDSPLEFRDNVFKTNTSLYLKSGLEKKLSVSYGRSLIEEDVGGNLYAGMKVNIINLELSKQVTLLQELTGEDLGDYIRDQYDNNAKTTTNVGIDIGVVWDTRKYRLGLVLENINSPSFEYNTIGEDCVTPNNTSASTNSCQVAAEFIQTQGELKAKETYTKEPLLRTDGLYKLTDNWLASAALDLVAYDDSVGFENQWMHLSTSYETHSFLIPSARIGYQKNLAGSKTSSLTFGLSLLKYLTLDFEYGLDDVAVDGSKYPRRLGFAMSISEPF